MCQSDFDYQIRSPCFISYGEIAKIMPIYQNELRDIPFPVQTNHVLIAYQIIHVDIQT